MALGKRLLVVVSVSSVSRAVTAAAGSPWVPCPVLTYGDASWNTSEARVAELRAIFAASAAGHAPWQLPSFDQVALGDLALHGFASECTLARVPLDHASPESSRDIEVFVKRLSPPPGLSGAAVASAPRHAVWLLSGGPGGSSADDVEPLHALLAERLQPRGDFEVFVLDHRGVGRSTRLGCRWSQAETPGSVKGVEIDDLTEWPGCLRSLALDFPAGGSRHFSATAAARDLHMLMERFRRPGQSVSVYGISYGTFWAGRYARLFPGHARAVVLDGVVSASGAVEPHQRLTFERWDLKMHEVGVAVLDSKCGQDDFCRSKLGSRPSEFAADLFRRLAGGGHCVGPLAALGGVAGLKRILGGLLYSFSGRGVIPALLYRLARCGPGDAEALIHLAHAKEELARESSCCGVRPADLQAPALRSGVLLRNVVLSELWETSTTWSEMQAWANQGWFSMETFIDWARVRLPHTWPIYGHDASFNTTLNTSSPVLMLNGDVDCQTPLWSAEHEYKTARSTAGVTLLTWPDAVHFTALNTPVEGGGDPCALTTIAAFLSNPGKEDAWRSPPCRARLRRLDFRGDADTNVLLWGTRDAYEGIVGGDAAVAATVVV